MSNKDLHNDIKRVRAISPVVATDDTPLVSQIIDRQGFESLEFVIATGTLADSGATFTVLVEDGDESNLSDNASVADAYLLGTEALASFDQSDDDAVLKIGYVGPKRYVRLTITPSGEGTGAPICVIAELGGARVAPQSTQQT